MEIEGPTDGRTDNRAYRKTSLPTSKNKNAYLKTTHKMKLYKRNKLIDFIFYLCRFVVVHFAKHHIPSDSLTKLEIFTSVTSRIFAQIWFGEQNI